MKGTQRRLICPQCGKGFFAWRPEDLPGARVKCYFCGHQFEDEAARRKAPAPVVPPAAPATPAATPAAPATPAATPAAPATPAATPAAPATPAATAGSPPPSETDKPAS